MSAGWSSLVARLAHAQKVEGSNPSPATNSPQTEGYPPVCGQVERGKFSPPENGRRFPLLSVRPPLLLPSRPRGPVIRGGISGF